MTQQLRFLFTLSLLTFSLVLTSCGSKSDNDGRRTTFNLDDDADQGLQGTFTEPQCHDNGFFQGLTMRLIELFAGGDRQLYSRTSIEIEGSQIQRVTRFYSSRADDGTCGQELARLIYEGQFSTDQVELDGDDEAGNIDIELQKAYVEPATGNMADLLSRIRFCGYQDYQAGARRDITGAQDETCPLGDEVPQTYFGSYELDDDDELYLTDPKIVGMATATEERSQIVSEDYFYVRE